MAYAHIESMTDSEVVHELNNSCTRVEGWELRPVVNNIDGTIKFAVAGVVYPFKPNNGERYAKGKEVFYGLRANDARRALRLGLEAMREAQESKQ